jgi:hypothetical protein
MCAAELEKQAFQANRAASLTLGNGPLELLIGTGKSPVWF